MSRLALRFKTSFLGYFLSFCWPQRSKEKGSVFMEGSFFLVGFWSTRRRQEVTEVKNMLGYGLMIFLGGIFSKQFFTLSWTGAFYGFMIVPLVICLFSVNWYDHRPFVTNFLLTWYCINTPQVIHEQITGSRYGRGKLSSFFGGFLFIDRRPLLTCGVLEASYMLLVYGQ